MSAEPQEALQEKKEKSWALQVQPHMRAVLCSKFRMCGTDEEVIILSFSFGEVQRTNSSVRLIKATEPFLDGKCASGFV